MIGKYQFLKSVKKASFRPENSDNIYWVDITPKIAAKIVSGHTLIIRNGFAVVSFPKVDVFFYK